MFGENVAQALECMREEKLNYKDYLPPHAINIGVNVSKALKDVWPDIKEKISGMMLDEIPYEYPYPSVWWYSVVCAIHKDANIFVNFVKYVRKNEDKFSLNTLFFLYYQLKSIAFVSSETDSYEGKKEMWALYKEIIDEYTKAVSVSLEPIPIENRDKDLIIVITEQFISVAHGPTKTALDRCKAIISKMGKKVLLINTAEVLSSVGEIPFYDMKSGSYMPEKVNENFQEWKGVQVPYIQCEQNMPNLDMLNSLLNYIRELSPSRIVSIGGSSVLSNLANKIIPVVTVGLGPADFEYTTTSYQTLSRKITETDIRLLSELGINEKHVIESVFTSSLKPQTEKITRGELGIPEDKFLIIVVGARLDQEVTDEFLKTMNDVVSDKMILCFLGYFNEYENKLSKYPELMKNSKFLGFCNDILSRMEICDLYVNPLRKGGGTSCVEAMYMGVPVVTCGYGDVSVNVGEDFWVEDYDEMKSKILQYYNDREFYEIMSEKARKRTEKLLDTEGEFVRILDEVEKRELEV